MTKKAKPALHHEDRMSAHFKELDAKRENAMPKVLEILAEKDIPYIDYCKLYFPERAGNECCFSCGNCIDGCSWSRDLIPVEGWIAEKIERNNSYKIFWCPEFNPESKDRELDYNGSVRLLTAIAGMAANDYRSILKDLTKLRDQYHGAGTKLNRKFAIKYCMVLDQKKQLEEVLYSHYRKIQMYENYVPDDETDQEIRKALAKFDNGGEPQ